MHNYAPRSQCVCTDWLCVYHPLATTFTIGDQQDSSSQSLLTPSPATQGPRRGSPEPDSSQPLHTPDVRSAAHLCAQAEILLTQRPDASQQQQQQQQQQRSGTQPGNTRTSCDSEMASSQLQRRSVPCTSSPNRAGVSTMDQDPGYARSTGASQCKGNASTHAPVLNQAPQCTQSSRYSEGQPQSQS